MGDTGIEFAAPGPGAWALDRSHYPGGTTPISEWLLTESMPAGMAKVFAELGAPVAGVGAGFVHGFMYTRVLPLVGADRPPRRPPPALVLRAVTRLHPEFRRRARAATVTLRERPSLAVADEWERSIRPGLIERNRALQAVDPEALDDDALEVHVGELLDHLRSAFELHFWLHGHDLGPIARFLHACIGWGIDPAEATAALAGASPSTARPLATLVRLRELIEAAPGEVTSLEDVRSVSAEAADLLDRHLDDHGRVLATGYDLTALTLVELPRLLLDTIRTVEPPHRRVDPDGVAAELRSQVPPDERADFDETLREARAVMDMRDDNGPLTVEWPMGLLRRALLAAGRRLEARGAVERAADAVELTPDEARRALSGGTPSAAALAARRDRRIELAAIDPPILLGEPEPEPPLDVLPGPLAELVGMIRVAFAHLGMDGAGEARPAADADRWSGVGVGVGRLVATARVAGSAEEAIERLDPGDVLVVRATSPAFNAVLAIAGGVVTADGGAMSHAAVLARELGIPAVVGAPGALEIPDGATIELDADGGLVRLVHPD